MNKFFMPKTSLIGKGALEESVNEIVERKYNKCLIVCDKVLVQNKLVNKLTDLLEEKKLEYCLFDGAQPNPTTKNVEDGLKIFKENNCDYVISFGGGSAHDCAKGISLVVSNGGEIKDYEGVNKSSKPQAPLFAINTTAGTASEMTIFCIITDEERHVKMAIVDVNVVPELAVDDPNLMVSMPKSLTAATGMDALTHAVEAYVSTAANDVTDACAVKAIRIVFKHLKSAVDDGNDMEARDRMCSAEFLAGMAFSNASLGYVHAMAHQLGGIYNLPHGVCNAILLPHVCTYNNKVAYKRYAELAEEIGIKGENEEELSNKFIEAIKTLSKSVGIPSGLSDFDIFKEEDIEILSVNALKDACGLTNPITASLEDIKQIFRQAI